MTNPDFAQPVRDMTVGELVEIVGAAALEAAEKTVAEKAAEIEAKVAEKASPPDAAVKAELAKVKSQLDALAEQLAELAAAPKSLQDDPPAPVPARDPYPRDAFGRRISS